MPSIKSLPSPKARLSFKLRQAIEFRVCGGMKITDACSEASFSPAGWHKAMKRPAVRDYLKEVQQAYVLEVDASAALYKARALEVAQDLMLNAKSESIRARMAEFLAGDAKAAQVAVHIDARQTPRGYEYVKPGQQIVEIVGQKE